MKWRYRRSTSVRAVDLGLDDLIEIWAKVTPATEDGGVKLAADELRASRKERHGAGGP